jgi:hypothetical protein
MMKKLLPILAIGVLLFSCKEKDLTPNNPPLPKENVVLSASYIYGDFPFKLDSMITNDIGQSFFVDEFKLYLSDFFFVNFQDTLLYDSIFPVYTFSDNSHRIARLPSGGYSGFYGARLGLDSANSASYDPSLLPPWADRADTNGFDHMVIKGRLIDATAIDPIDTVGTIPFEIRLGTYLTSKIFRSPQTNFAIQQGFDIQFVMQINFEPVFNKMNLVLRPMIASDPTIPADFQAAIEVKDSLQIGVF